MQGVRHRRSRGVGAVQCLALLAWLASAACSEDEPGGDAEQSAGSGGRTQSGGSGVSGAGSSGGAGSGPGKAGSGGGGTGAGFPTDLEGSCTTDADCELCTAPLGLGGDCCPGCPVVTSKEICAQLAAAFEACGPGLQLCPVPLCVFPGSPACSAEGKCVMGDGLQR